MKAKNNQLKAGWSKSQNDVMYAWGDGVSKSDAHLLHNFLTILQGFGAKTFLKELESRGYDIKTLKFSIEKKAPNIACTGQEPSSVVESQDTGGSCQ